ncbi:bis-aminopropyl spermidine synthase family protein [Salinactinospora qingdaonensis]|uniref:Bis-aminopropyl spermidine synthase family protein n=1 Tax=Salinactinospora qingdaonensis TaxID=702744 RepID=A0ABP7FQH5_9ACTN
MNDLPAELSAHLSEQGVDASRSRLVLSRLADGRWWSARELVRATAVAHRVVSAVLDALGDTLEHEGERVRLPGPTAGEAFTQPEVADPVGHLLAEHAEAARELERLVAQAPRPRADLDHVSATAATALRRAVLCTTRFALEGRHVLCVGDHDLTSLALRLVQPECEVAVVDIDERILDYIAAAADRLDLPVHCYFADLRASLPRAVRGRADLVFTDPPYTPEGVELFVRHGLAGLADTRHSRILLAYGASETTPALAAKTQDRLGRMRLTFEAIWPGFNRYLGAEAIGAASDLYLLRPTSRSPVGQSAPLETARIYSQGSNARESTGGLEPDAATALLEGSETCVAVGQWPAAALGPHVGHVRLATWLTTESTQQAGTAVVNLAGGWETLALRAILAAQSEQVRVVVATASPEGGDEGRRRLPALLAPRWNISFSRPKPDAEHTVITARRASQPPDDAAGQLLAHCQERAHGSVASVLREGVTRVAAARHTPVNKRTARTLVAQAAPWLSGHTLIDLPERYLERLPQVAAHLVAALD